MRNGGDRKLASNPKMASAMAAFPDISKYSDENLDGHHYFPGAASFFEDIDKLVAITMRDGRNLLGHFRGYDQFGNIMIEGAKERFYHGTQFGEEELGFFIIRGENVAYFGVLDHLPDLESRGFQRVSVQQIKERVKAEGKGKQSVFADPANE